MDNNRDGIIDDPLVTRKKVGRKPLKLTEDEWKVRRQEQRHARAEKKKQDERYEVARYIVDMIASSVPKATQEAVYDADNEFEAEIELLTKLDKIAENLAADPTIILKRTPKKGKPGLAGYKGERLKRAIKE